MDKRTPDQNDPLEQSEEWTRIKAALFSQPEPVSSERFVEKVMVDIDRSRIAGRSTLLEKLTNWLKPDTIRWLAPAAGLAAAAVLLILSVPAANNQSDLGDFVFGENTLDSYSIESILDTTEEVK